MLSYLHGCNLGFSIRKKVELNESVQEQKNESITHWAFE
jgi:hypothetical protein